MPPRKKSATADADSGATVAAPKRRSSRTKAKASPATQAPAAKKAKAAGKKRARSESEDEEEKSQDEDRSVPSTKSEAGEAKDGQGQEEEDKKEVKVLKRGGAAIDPFSGNVASHMVYQNAEGIWDARMNQTDIGKNNNKYYILQLQHPIGNSGVCTLFTHWGRLGENGQKQVKGPWDSTTAVMEFKKQFKVKSGVNWENRAGMTAAKGKYLWLPPAEEDAEEAVDEEDDAKTTEPIPESMLPAETQELCKLIFNDQIIQHTLKELNYDARKLPLGKLSKDTINMGFTALKKLAEVLEDPMAILAKQYSSLNAALQQLSGEYYSIIPHAFGRSVPVTIDDKQMLKKELDLLEALRDMEIAQKLIVQPVKLGPPVNPLDKHFESLGLSFMDPVRRLTKEFKALEAYTRDTHGKTHMHYQAKVLNAFRVEREKETNAWDSCPHKLNTLKDGERLLLWHGSRSTNFAGILSQGLRIAPPEAPVTGYMFGKGVYFADMMSKSANYCHAYMSSNIGILLLCEVAAKPFHELENSDYNADEGCRRNNKLCTKGVGKTQPGAWQDAGEALDNPSLAGVHMPVGPVQDQQIGGYLQYNEYIVYDAAQIRVRYLLMVEMN